MGGGLSVRVYAVNVLGKGPYSDPVTVILPTTHDQLACDINGGYLLPLSVISAALFMTIVVVLIIVAISIAKKVKTKIRMGGLANTVSSESTYEEIHLKSPAPSTSDNIAYLHVSIKNSVQHVQS